MINHYNRYQVGLTLNDLFPVINGKCACGCGQSLLGKRKKWSSDTCRDNSFIEFAIIKGDTSVIRKKLNLRDKGACCECGVITNSWHADHIIPVFNGGGGLGLENYQTLCINCHKEKTYKESQRNAISSHADSILLKRWAVADGQYCVELLNKSIDTQSLLDTISPVSANASCV